MPPLTLEFENLLQLLFAFQGGLFFVLMVAKLRLRPFSFFCLALACHMTSNLMAETGILSVEYNFTSSFGFLYGPLLLISFQRLTLERSTFSGVHILHFLPFLVSLLFPVGSVALKIAMGISVVLYGVLIFRYIRAYRKTLDDMCSDGYGAKLEWVSIAAVLFGTVTAYDVVRLTLPYLMPFDEQVAYLITLASVFLLLNFLILKVFQFPEVFWGLKLSEIVDSDDDKVDDLSNSEQADFDRALEVFEHEALYLDPHLRLMDFAKRVSLDGRTLSRLIKRATGDRFAVFVNRRRVAHSLTLIQEKQLNTNFARIAYESGFNSKSAFNAAFKKFTGKTPSQFKQVI